MADFPKQYALWDEFLAVWPLSRLATMTLDEYSQAGSKDCFVYWIEIRLEDMGRIWGGSAFKFGVFARKNLDAKESADNRCYSDTHGWYASLGATAQEAFTKVRDYVVQVATLAQQGDVDGIEAFEHLGEATKWKIAFHYQHSRQTPTIVNVFTKAPIAAFVGSETGRSMATLQKAALNKMPSGLGILEYGWQMWEEWSRKNLAIWKMSHGSLSPLEQQQYLGEKVALMYGDSGKEQSKKFTDAPIGSLFFLCHGNSPQCLGQFTSAAQPSRKDAGWLQRSYRVLKTAQRTDRYTANSKNWSPQGNSTFWQVGAHDLPEFESTLLKPYFATDLAELADLAGEPMEATTPEATAPFLPPTAPQKSPVLRAPVNRIYYGPPGTGKTYMLGQLVQRDYGALPQNYCFVTFHQSYGYEEFVEGLRPVLNASTGAGEVRYEIRPGVFKDLCRRARLAPHQRFAMVIDEINRGNISKIFGELITLVEIDKREGAEHAVSVLLPYSGELFSIPANVDIIGTMNTADRSLALLDTALRRRFDFVALMPDTREEKDPHAVHSAPLAGLVVSAGQNSIDIRQMLHRMNQRIEALYDRDHCIGHAYFTPLAKEADGDARFSALGDIFRNRIVPLLEEYFFEDWQKIRLVLADNQKRDPQAHFVQESLDAEEDLTGLFGRDHGLDTYATRRHYAVQPTAFTNPDAYIGIYQP